jgi:hypothetical protein
MGGSEKQYFVNHGTCEPSKKPPELLNHQPTNEPTKEPTKLPTATNYQPTEEPTAAPTKKYSLITWPLGGSDKIQSAAGYELGIESGGVQQPDLQGKGPSNPREEIT